MGHVLVTENEGRGGGWDAENVSCGDLKIQNISGQSGATPHVGNMHLLLPVPSTITSQPYCAALPYSLSWRLVLL